MLRRAEKSDLDILLPLLNRSPELTIRLSALLRAYGTGQNFFCVWIQDDFSAVLYRLDDTFSLTDLGGADYEEAAFFLNFEPYFRVLTGEYETVAQIAELLCAPDPEKMNLMRFTHGAGVPDPQGSAIDRAPDLKSVYSLISANLPLGASFDAWYADISHRIRHGCAKAYLMRQGEVPACACLVSAESDSAGLISRLCTAPDARGKGLGSALLGEVCRELSREGRAAVLECTDSLRPFYERRGFELFTHTGELERP